MSTFKITVEEIDKVWEHPNAERLELASLKGMTFQFCVVKDFYKAGDKVVYFPVDSLLPENVLSLIGLEGKLSGAAKNRVKTIKLRGQISMGVVSEPEAFSSFGISEETPVGTDLTELLGIVKYEPEPVSIRDGRLVPLPQLVQKYDIEGADRHPEIIEMLLDEPVMVTEKIEGSHFSASLYADGDYAVCQRNFRILPTEEKLHDWHKAAQEIQLEDKLKLLYKVLEATNVVTIRGEIIGPDIQKNIYGLSKRRIVFFEIEKDGIPLSPMGTVAFLNYLELSRVPMLYPTMKEFGHGGTLREYLGNRTVQAASSGLTVLEGAKEPSKTLREGIVIRPMNERHDIEFGRVIIKQRSPEYLAESGL